MVMDELQKINYDKLHVVWGMVNDKDFVSILKLLPKDALYYFCKPNIPRGLDVKQLEKAAEKLNLTGQSMRSVELALKKAKSSASESDLIFVGGSTFVVAEALP